jgi:hypothetical protein
MARLDGKVVELEAHPDGEWILTPTPPDGDLPLAQPATEGVRTLRYRIVPELPAGLELVDASLAFPGATFDRIVP